jgi:intracellular septation protein
MKNLVTSATLLLLDLASTFVFLGVVLITGKPTLAIIAGMAFGAAQIGWEFLRKRPIGTMQWLSLMLVMGFGGISLFTGDPRFVMIKPSLIYGIVGVVMLKPGWMNRYLPPIALAVVPDVAVVFGYVWAGLMFFSAALNLVLALNLSPVVWSEAMSIYGTGSKIALFFIQYATLRLIGLSRHRRGLIPAEVLDAVAPASLST